MRQGVLAVLCLVVFVGVQGATIYETLTVNNDFNTLANFIGDNTDLIDILNSDPKDRNSTLFAPVNAAWTNVNIPPEDLENALKYHIVDGNHPTDGLVTGLLDSLYRTSSLGPGFQKLSVVVQIIQPSEITINMVAEVTGSQIKCDNGYIIPINAVLVYPGNITSVIAKDPGFTDLMDLVEAAGFEDQLDENLRTVLGPNNEAFKKLDPAVVNYLKTFKGKGDLKQFLETWFLDKILYASDISNGLTEKAANGEMLTFAINEDTSVITVNQKANITDTNILASNGVAYGLNTVLEPAGFKFTSLKSLLGNDLTSTQQTFNITKMDPILTGDEDYTIFAATNEAWTVHKIPVREELMKLVPLCVVKGKITTAGMSDNQLVPSLYHPDTVIGDIRLRINVQTNEAGNDYFVNDIKITSPDHETSNGVIHIIEAVLDVPPSIESLIDVNDPPIDQTPMFFKHAGLQDKLNLPKMTFLLPMSDAWGKLPHGAEEYLISPLGETALHHILLNHVVPEQMLWTFDITDKPTEFTTLYGMKLNIKKEGDIIVIDDNDAEIVSLTDNVFSNGVVQFLDNLLIPPDLKFDMEMLLEGLEFSTTLSALKTAGLDNIVKDQTGSHTIFAPNNSAWQNADFKLDKLNKEKVTKLMKVHIVKGVVKKLEAGKEYETLLDGVKLRAVNDYSVEVVGQDGDASKVFSWSPSQGDNGNIYGIETLLDYDLGLGGSDDLSAGIIVLIVFLVLCFVCAFIAAAGVGIWYVQRRRPYSTIN